MPKNVVCKKCNNLVNDWCEKVIDSPDPDMQRDCQYFCEKTNADRIRAMNDEELASWFCNSVTMECCYNTCPARHICSGDDNGMLKWLKQPFEGE